jgi:hypothetical protein
MPDRFYACRVTGSFHHLSLYRFAYAARTAVVASPSPSAAAAYYPAGTVTVLAEGPVTLFILVVCGVFSSTSTAIGLFALWSPFFAALFHVRCTSRRSSKAYCGSNRVVCRCFV